VEPGHAINFDGSTSESIQILRITLTKHICIICIICTHRAATIHIRKLRRRLPRSSSLLEKTWTKEPFDTQKRSKRLETSKFSNPLALLQTSPWELTVQPTSKPGTVRNGRKQPIYTQIESLSIPTACKAHYSSRFRLWLLSPWTKSVTVAESKVVSFEIAWFDKRVLHETQFGCS